METSQDIVTQYFELQEKLFEYFGYEPDWKIIPPDPCMGHHWMITGPEDDNSSHVVWSKVPFTKQSIEEGMEIYSGTIYTQRFLPKWVYRGPNHTMVSVDTHTDGNRALMIFDNDKECKDQEMMDAFNEKWGSL